MSGDPHSYFDPWRPKHGAESDPADFEMRTTPYHRTHRLFGQGHTAMFGGNPTASVFGSASVVINSLRNVNGHDPIKETLIGMARGERNPEEIDPRFLLKTQPSVTSSGVRYYMEDPKYLKTGETYADKSNIGNRFPVIYEHSDRGQRFILSGHHRAAAAIGLGQPLPALVIRHSEWS